ncbi:MAG: hypothetical protein WAL50_12090 [Kineosporiaceae bacterium]
MPHQVLAAVVIATLLLLVSRRLNRRSRYGPLRLMEVILSEGGDSEKVNARAEASIRALIMECLQVRRVQAHGVIPSYSGIDARATDLQGGPVYPEPANLLTRVSVALIQSSVIDQGFSVTVTQTPAQPPFTVGLSFTVQRVSTGAIELVDACWSTSLDEAARKVGFRLAAWQESRRNRGWRRSRTESPNAASMRYQHAALVEGRHRRYDGAVRFARQGLRADPGNVALRRHLGETYERLGLGLDAMIVYASGLIGLNDEDNGWRNRPLDGFGHEAQPRTPALDTIEAAAWPKPLRRRRSVRRDTESAGLFWRYIANLGMSENWADTLIAETCRVDDLNRRPGPAAGSHPWFGERSLEAWPGVPSSYMDLHRIWLAERERSGLVRGFLARRYHDLLSDEFPLLYASWFDERLPKEDPFPKPGTSGGPTTTEVREAAQRRTPPKRWRRSTPPTVVTLKQQVHDLDAALAALAALHGTARGGPPLGLEQNAEVVALYEGTKQCFSAALAYVLSANGTPAADVGPQERDALTAMRPGHATEWKALRLTRPIVVACVTRLMTQLSAVHRHVNETYGSSVDSPLDEAMHSHGRLFAQVAASLDLPLVLTACAMNDLEHLVAGRAETTQLGDSRLSRLLWLMAHHRYCSRLLHLERAAGFGLHTEDAVKEFLGEADTLIRITHERIESIIREPRLLGLPAAVRYAVARLPWWRPAVRRDDEPWSLSYYAACTYAVTIPDYPGSIDGEATPMQGGDANEPNLRADNAYHHWCRRYDAVAKLAIHQLDAAVALRAQSTRTMGSKGIADWILAEDPDLDMLRRHPRFRRWAAQQFQVTLVPDWRSTAFLAMRASRFRKAVLTDDAQLEAIRTGQPWNLLFQPRCALGVLGSTVPWNTAYVRSGLTHTHYLVKGLLGTVPTAIDRLNAMAHELSEPGQGSNRVRSSDVASVADSLVRFWSTVPLYRAFNSAPELRLEMGVLLRRLGGLEHMLTPSFPREAEVLLEARFIDFDQLDGRLRVRTADGLRAALTLQQLIASGQAMWSERARAAGLLRTCSRELAELLADLDRSLTSAPSRMSLRRFESLDDVTVDVVDLDGAEESPIALG